jgi:hypothetical protein
MATQLGLQYDPTPPYYVNETPTLGDEQITSLVEELENGCSDPNDAYNKEIKRISYNVSRREKRARAKSQPSMGGMSHLPAAVNL